MVLIKLKNSQSLATERDGGESPDFGAFNISHQSGYLRRSGVG